MSTKLTTPLYQPYDLSRALMYLTPVQREVFMKQLIWTAVFQVIDLLQVLFKEYVLDKSGFDSAAVDRDKTALKGAAKSKTV